MRLLLRMLSAFTTERLSRAVMGIRFACHACQKPLHIKTELAGKRGVCPHCGIRFRIPSDASVSSIPIEDATASGAQTQVSGADAARVPAALPVSSGARPSGRAELNSGPSLLDDPTAVWYVRPPSGGQYGPATGDVLRIWIAEARVTATSLVWRDGWPQWRSAAETLTEFGAAALPTPSPIPIPLKQMASSHSAAPAPAVPTLTGDKTLGARKSRVTNRRIVVAGGLAALSVTLIVILIFLIQRG